MYYIVSSEYRNGENKTGTRSHRTESGMPSVPTQAYIKQYKTKDYNTK